MADALAVAVGTQLSVTQTSGPLPDPEILRKYDEVCPGLAMTIVKSAQDEADHRRGLEKTIVSAQTHDIHAQRIETRLGQLFAFGVAMCGIITGGWAMTHGAQIAGSVVSGTTLASIVGAFLYRQSQASKSPKPKAALSGATNDLNPIRKTE